jgi:hypothetical protein
MQGYLRTVIKTLLLPFCFVQEAIEFDQDFGGETCFSDVTNGLFSSSRPSFSLRRCLRFLLGLGLPQQMLSFQLQTTSISLRRHHHLAAQLLVLLAAQHRRRTQLLCHILKVDLTGGPFQHTIQLSNLHNYLRANRHSSALCNTNLERLKRMLAERPSGMSSSDVGGRTKTEHGPKTSLHQSQAARKIHLAAGEQR